MRLPAPLASARSPQAWCSSSLRRPPARRSPTRPARPARALQCGSLDVPLDRSGAVPGTVRLAAARRVAPSNPTRDARSSRSPAVPARRRSRSSPTSPTLLAPALATRDLLCSTSAAPALSSPLRLLACRGTTLTRDGTRCASEHRRRARPVHDGRERRGPRGPARRERLRQARPLRRLLRHEGRARLRRAPSRPASQALVLDSVVLPPGPDPLQRSTFAAMRRVLARAVRRRRVQRHLRATRRRDLASRVRSLARRALRGLLTSARGVRQRVRDRPQRPLQRPAHRRPQPDAARRAAGRADVRARAATRHR